MPTAAAIVSAFADRCTQHYARVIARALELRRLEAYPPSILLTTSDVAHAFSDLRGAPQIDLSRWQNIDSAHSSEICAAYIWSRYRKIYRYDPDMYEQLIDQTDDLSAIPVDALLSMPFPCVFIETPGAESMDGFFTWVESAKETERYLSFLPMKGDEPGLVTTLLLESCTVPEAFERMQKNMLTDPRYVQLFGEDALRSMIRQERILYRRLSKYLPLVLYLCSQEPDILRRTKRGYVPPKPTTPGAPPAESRETQTWDVGVRIGAAIRLHAGASIADPTPGTPGGSHAPARPHMRRAHWHHFWTGAKSDPAARKLVLRWLAPIAVNFDASETYIPTVIHNVKE